MSKGPPPVEGLFDPSYSIAPWVPAASNLDIGDSRSFMHGYSTASMQQLHLDYIPPGSAVEARFRAMDSTFQHNTPAFMLGILANVLARTRSKLPTSEVPQENIEQWMTIAERLEERDRELFVVAYTIFSQQEEDFMTVDGNLANEARLRLRRAAQYQDIGNRQGHGYAQEGLLAEVSYEGSVSLAALANVCSREQARFTART